jgi:hypothetical protein
MENAQKIFDRLWDDYTRRNPEVRRIYDLFLSKREKVVNDHIAFRTCDDPRVNIGVLAKPFIDTGYIYKGEYHFGEKHLYARHFEHKEKPDAPRVFISELKTREFSSFMQETIGSVINRIPKSLLASDELIFSGNSWGTPSFEIYSKLRNESEYAAWIYVHGFRANHFTISVNALKKHDSVQKVNRLLKDNGFLLNDSAGEIKGTPQQLLEQSSTRSGIIEIRFKEGTYGVPSCYYEFAKRYPDKDGKLYSGFIAKSADKIFESTDYYEKNKS